ncbi:Ctr-domain-containing protein [Metschnikowia bicuspidata var. bicuspidata NRRL YB-4993]|uniref:Copper transport protein n=1 Tax=Metschnikowia bicuspidata var. bicuspidata NRRL YB-4993 TaxID=869754 RepID=A0A1A0H503_9ASCO|nr:Ctr-domain-containing protein [Metschnikowia bicuspidata var. bicuspidata NRRL YB-4993]OBA19116.1 Ctr-domain-containing protein [Metschnikowia bicuspidata var. bicuspidata NRRL YB-4993]
MASSTTLMDMSMSSMTGMSSLTASMDMSDMDMDMSSMSMNMYFSLAYEGYPVLFKGFSASNAGQAFGIFLLFFVASFVTKGFEFVKVYLELKVWNNPNYQTPQVTTIAGDCGCDDENEKVSDASEGYTPTGNQKQSSILTVVGRDTIRIVLCFLIEMFGYAMMLVAMTFSLVYFFAVVLGMAFGRVFFEKLSERLNIRPGANNFQGHH